MIVGPFLPTLYLYGCQHILLTYRYILFELKLHIVLRASTKILLNQPPAQNTSIVIFSLENSQCKIIPVLTSSTNGQKSPMNSFVHTNNYDSGSYQLLSMWKNQTLYCFSRFLFGFGASSDNSRRAVLALKRISLFFRSTFLQSSHMHLSLHVFPFAKHRQYFITHLEFTHLQPSSAATV